MLYQIRNHIIQHHVNHDSLKMGFQITASKYVFIFCSSNKRHLKFCSTVLFLLFWLKNKVKSLLKLLPFSYSRFHTLLDFFYFFNFFISSSMLRDYDAKHKLSSSAVRCKYCVNTASYTT